MSDQEDRYQRDSRDGDRSSRRGGGGRPPRRYYSGGGGRGRRTRGCTCPDNVSYKDVDTLRQFINDEGKIRPRRQTKVCSKCQRKIAVAIKRARHLALLPFTGHHVQEFS